MAAPIDHPPRHPVSATVDAVGSALADVAEVPVWAMSPDETAATLTELARLTAQVAALEARVAGHADRVDVAESTGATSTANWWAHATRQTRATTHRKLWLAAGLDTCARVRDALTAGHVVADQAEAIIRALEALPDDLDAGIRDQAEQRLVELAADHDAKHLKVLGRRILDVVAPEIGEAHEAKLLAREERAAAAKVRLTMHDDGHGTTYGRFSVPTAQGEMFRKALLAHAAPKHRAAVDGGLGERRPSPERMGQAFVDYIERYPADRLPNAGGLNATVVVTMTLDALRGGLEAAQLDTGAVISAAQARRLACEAGIIPAVLGGDGVVLDLGRKRRFHTPAQRIALSIERGGCEADGCDYPPGLCHAHHDTAWSRDGGTSVRNGRLLCPRHHARAHDPAFTMTKLATGKVQFVRRT